MEKRYNHLIYEKKLRERWLELNPYTHRKNPGPLFSIDTPPPTVSGNLHVGHIFSYTQTDIIARYKRMNGYSVYYPFGFDDNGLPTERYVEKKYNTNAAQLGRAQFIELCLQETEKMGEQFRELWQQIGLSVDWDYCYSTISDHVRKISQESFIRLYKKDCIYKKFEPSLYCTTCRTSVAQAELDDIEKPSLFTTITFDLIDDGSVDIATTRPELLPSCVAIFYHPADSRYQSLQNKKASVPFFGQEVPIIADELVDPEKGTGIVMCCAFGDKTDVLWIKKHGLAFQQSIGYNGKMMDGKNLIHGLSVPDARTKIVEILKKQDRVKGQKEILHTVNVHERCKKEIEYLALWQWFLSILPLKHEFLRLGQEIAWHPEFMQSRYQNWVENISWDWCLSRQRVFGIPFPVWHCNTCKSVLLADLKDLPIDPQATPYPGGVCPYCGSNDISPDMDVMDTWNTSSLTPFIIYDLYTGDDVSPFEKELAEGFFPVSMRPQAHDIIRTWAFYTIVKSYLHNRIIPWNTIIISGHVLTEGKEKLSKSKDQKKISPEFLLTQYPADAIRYWTASATLGHDVLFSETQLKLGQRLITKLWNAYRFIVEHISAPLDPQPKQLGLINEWVLHQATYTYQKYTGYFDHYVYNLALDTIDHFFWHDICDNYLELIKDQLFHPDLYDPQEVQATKWTLSQLGLRILQLYAPYMPFITEALYQEVYAPKMAELPSLHQTKFTAIQEEFQFTDAAHVMEHILKLVALTRKLKTEKQLSLNAPITNLTIATTGKDLIEHLKKQEQLIKGITKAENILYITDQAIESSIVLENGTSRITILL